MPLSVPSQGYQPSSEVPQFTIHTMEFSTGYGYTSYPIASVFTTLTSGINIHQTSSIPHPPSDSVFQMTSSLYVNMTSPDPTSSLIIRSLPLTSSIPCSSFTSSLPTATLMTSGTSVATSISTSSHDQTIIVADSSPTHMTSSNGSLLLFMNRLAVPMTYSSSITSSITSSEITTSTISNSTLSPTNVVLSYASFPSPLIQTSSISQFLVRNATSTLQEFNGTENITSSSLLSINPTPSINHTSSYQFNNITSSFASTVTVSVPAYSHSSSMSGHSTSYTSSHHSSKSNHPVFIPDNTFSLDSFVSSNLMSSTLSPSSSHRTFSVKSRPEFNGGTNLSTSSILYISPTPSITHTSLYAFNTITSSIASTVPVIVPAYSHSSSMSSHSRSYTSSHHSSKSNQSGFIPGSTTFSLDGYVSSNIMSSTLFPSPSHRTSSVTSRPEFNGGTNLSTSSILYISPTSSITHTNLYAFNTITSSIASTVIDGERAYLYSSSVSSHSMPNTSSHHSIKSNQPVFTTDSTRLSLGSSLSSNVTPSHLFPSSSHMTSSLNSRTSINLTSLDIQTLNSYVGATKSSSFNNSSTSTSTFHAIHPTNMTSLIENSTAANLGKLKN